MSTFTLIKPIAGKEFTISEFNTDLQRIQDAIRGLQDSTPTTGTVTSFSDVTTSVDFMFSTTVANPSGAVVQTFTVATGTGTGSAGKFLASPSGGGTGVLSARIIALNDLPTVTYTKGGSGLTTLGSAYQMLRVNATPDGFEYFTLSSFDAKLTVTTGSGTLVLRVIPSAIEVNDLAATTPLSIAKGGTASATAQAGINALSAVSGASAGQVLTKVGSNASWSTVSTGITSLNALTGTTQTFAVGTGGSGLSISSSGTVHTFNLPDAGTSTSGIINISTQNISGVKTFLGQPVFNTTTASRILFSGTSKELTDDADLTFTIGTNTLNTVNISATTLITSSDITATDTITAVNEVISGTIVQSKIRTTDNADTATNADHMILCDPLSGGGAYVQKLPDTATIATGFEIIVKKITTGGAVTVEVFNVGTETIDSATSFILNTGVYDFIVAIYTGSSKWRIISKEITP